MGKKQDIEKKIKKTLPKFDIFKEASNAVIKRTIVLTEEKLTTQNSVPEKPALIVRKTFAELKDAVDNEHAERFNNLLHTLPDREFVRVYLKVLEYFKPKIVRELGGEKNGGDTTINILIQR